MLYDVLLCPLMILKFNILNQDCRLSKYLPEQITDTLPLAMFPNIDTFECYFILVFPSCMHNHVALLLLKQVCLFILLTYFTNHE